MVDLFMVIELVILIMNGVFCVDWLRNLLVVLVVVCVFVV